MVAVLTQRAAKPSSTLRGISSAGIIEEGQLYAVCMQELAAQMSVHSPALSEMSGRLFHGFVGLFQRSVSHQEARLARERDAQRTQLLGTWFKPLRRCLGRRFSNSPPGIRGRLPAGPAADVPCVAVA